MFLRWSMLAVAAGLSACATPAPLPPAAPATVASAYAPCSESGAATWYRGTSKARAARGELTAAHRTLPLGTQVRVTSVDTGRSVVVRINDRGPFSKGRIIDLAVPAADQLGMRRDGVAQVRLEPDTAADGCPFQEARLHGS